MTQKDQKIQREFMKAYEPIHDRFERFCRARAYGVMDQEDLMNETLCRAYEGWEKIKNKKALLYFLFGTAKNILKNTIRKKKEFDLTPENELRLTTDNRAESDLEIAFLYEQLNKLPELKRETLILFEISGFSIKEIAKIQNTTEGAINMRLKRARQELKVLLKDVESKLMRDEK